jgi:hypothetical protein
MVLVRLAHGTHKFAQFILKFKNSVTAINYKKLLFGLAGFVKAIAEPTETVLYLTVPRRLIFPVNLFNVSKSVELEVHADSKVGRIFYFILKIDFQFKLTVGLLGFKVLDEILVAGLCFACIGYNFFTIFSVIFKVVFFIFASSC